MSAFIVFLFTVVNSGLRGQWDYDEPTKNTGNWSALYPECGNQRQSPIDLSINSASCVEPLLLEWQSSTEHFAIRNTGHSLRAIPLEISTGGDGDLSNLEVLHHTNDTNIKLQNAFYNTYKSLINKEYCFDSLHFHWGTSNDTGSEHTVNGQAYPLEVHLVHYSCDWYVASQALSQYTDRSTADDSSQYDDMNVLAVIGVLFEIGAANPVIEQILDDVIMPGIRPYHDPSERFGDHLLELYYSEFDVAGLLPTNRAMVAYQGSLTTPPCYETVRWHVMKEIMTVSAEQMNKFRSLLESTNLNDSMAPNYRPVQPLNNRTIYECQEQLDAEMVEKDEVVITESETERELRGKANVWLKTGVIFICLFSVTVVIAAFLMSFVYQQEQTLQRQRRQFQESMSRFNRPECDLDGNANPDDSQSGSRRKHRDRIPSGRNAPTADANA